MFDKGKELRSQGMRGWKEKGMAENGRKMRRVRRQLMRRKKRGKKRKKSKR